MQPLEERDTNSGSFSPTENQSENESASMRLSPPNVELSNQKFDDLVNEKKTSTTAEKGIPAEDSTPKAKSTHSCAVSGCKFVALHAKDLTRHARIHTGRIILSVCAKM